MRRSQRGSGKRCSSGQHEQLVHESASSSSSQVQCPGAEPSVGHVRLKDRRFFSARSALRRSGSFLPTPSLLLPFSGAAGRPPVRWIQLTAVGWRDNSWWRVTAYAQADAEVTAGPAGECDGGVVSMTEEEKGTQPAPFRHQCGQPTGSASRNAWRLRDGRPSKGPPPPSGGLTRS